MRRTLLFVTLLFIAVLGTLTISDVINNGITPIAVVSVMILVFFSIAIVGALREQPPE